MNPWLAAFLNSFAFMVVGAIMVYVGMGLMFPKRHSALLFAAYMMIKGLLWSFYDASYVLGTMGAPEYAFQVVGTPLLGVLSYVVLYYTWKGEFYKVGLGGFALDVIMSVAMTPVFFLADALFPAVVPFDYRGYLGVATLFRCLGMAALNLLFLYLARPLFKWFGSYEFVHKKAWQAVVIASIIMATLPRMNSTLQVAHPVMIALVLGVFLLIPLGAYLVSRVRIERKRKALLENEVRLAKNYVRSIREQLPFLEESAVQLDKISEEVARVQGGVEDEGLKEQVICLSAICDQLRHGVYSDSPVLDVVLIAGEREYEEAGLQVTYRVSPLGDEAVQAAMVSQTMLSWALDSCKAAMLQGEGRLDVLRAKESGRSVEGNVELRIVREGDQLAFMLNMPTNRKRRFPKRLLAERAQSFSGVLTETDDGVRKAVRALVLIEQDNVSASAS